MEPSNLNAKQQEAVGHDQGPILVVAGAGTGKTAVITQRIVRLINDNKAQPSEILALTFTDKAAAQMEERVDQLLPYGVVETRIMTFHAFGDSLIKQYASDIGLDSNYILLKKPQQLVFLREHIDQLKLDYFAPIGNPDSYLESLSSYIGRLKEELVNPDDYVKWATEQKAKAETEADKLEADKQVELANAYKVYQKLMRQRGMIDFGDQIGLVIELFNRRPNVLNAVRKGIKYILVDEFQDTNFAQAELLRMMGGKDGNIMVVGDDDQSIYKFRGAAISNILGFTKNYPEAKQVVLTDNYRSTQAILDNAYRLIKHNDPDRLEVRNNIDKYLKAQSDGAQPKVMVTANYSSEAELIADQIEQRLNAGEAAGEIAVLIRKHSLAGIVIKALEAKGVPYRYSGLQSLYQQPEVQVLLHFLDYIVDPGHSLSLYHLLSGPVYSASPTELAEAAARARRTNLSLDRVLRETAWDDNDYGQLITKFLADSDSWRMQSQKLTVGQLCYQFITESGYLTALTKASRKNPAIEAEVRNISQFFSLLEEYERVAEDKSAISYVLNMGALREAGDAPEAVEADYSQDEVQIMTVHKAKGLEFETVYLFDLTRGTFPSPNRRESLIVPDALLTGETLPGSDWHLQEERRLMYVAMTRAKNNLIMTYSPDHGGLRAKQPSPFIKEALGIDPPMLTADAKPSPLEQIEMFAPIAKNPANLRPRFIKGDLLKLTPHQIDDYLSCPMNFHYRYVLEVPQPPAPALMYGSLIHQLINYYFSRRMEGNEVDLAELLNQIPKLWKPDGFISAGQEERRRKQAEQTITNFYNREQKATRLPQYTEREFNFELPEIGVVVSGRFDAVYTDPVEIRDYKTSQEGDSDKADSRAAKSVQLAIYALAWQKLTGQAPDKVVLDFVETGQLGTATKSAADLDRTEADIAKVAAGIRAGDYRQGKNCFYCLHEKVTTNV